ncbi:hypothetical protein T02_7703 [Trichinella nativa]|uniref:Uncharacterized protein n=1 Tax=Trichinella nativa TaxID=6335 RepID=A0A0V1LPQ9_9BILA|nr:hypothetical protein T02_7703 [Trichinella nativa]
MQFPSVQIPRQGCIATGGCKKCSLVPCNQFLVLHVYQSLKRTGYYETKWLIDSFIVEQRLSLPILFGFPVGRSSETLYIF